jgi:arrestin-1
MVINFKVFKKSSPNGKINIYMGKRDFVDHISSVERIDGIVVLDDEYVRDNRKVFGQVVCSFRYGRSEDEVMGLNFQKELFLASEQIYPPLEKSGNDLSKVQERLLKKLGSNAFGFNFTIPSSAPASITLQQAKDEEGDPCKVEIEQSEI